MSLGIYVDRALDQVNNNDDVDVGVVGGKAFTYRFNKTDDDAPFEYGIARSQSSKWYLFTNCEHNDSWCYCATQVVKTGADRPLFAGQAGKDWEFILPVYPEVDFGLTIDFVPARDDAGFNVVLEISEVNKNEKYDCGYVSVLTTVSQLQTLVDDIISYVMDISEIIKRECKTCKVTIDEAETNRAKWMIAVNYECDECYSKRAGLKESVPVIGTQAEAVVSNTNSITSRIEAEASAIKAATVTKATVSMGSVKTIETVRAERNKLAQQAALYIQGGQ